MLQTGQPKAFKSDRINKILDANYTALEKEDMLMFKPTFRKAYARWCDSRGIKDMSKMTEQQMEQAGKYALYKAEHATFRDDSTFARKICGYKTKSAGKKGKTALGTGGYRAANMAIEGHLPFVKTPVNILRRSIDYSPLGIAKGISKLAKVESAEAFKDGIHEICSGMTGNGNDSYESRNMVAIVVEMCRILGKEGCETLVEALGKALTKLMGMAAERLAGIQWTSKRYKAQNNGTVISNLL